MAIARTRISPTIQSPIGGAEGMEGKLVTFDDFSITDDTNTTAAIYCGGLIPWRLCNESGGSLTFTLYAAREQDGTALTPYDSDIAPVPTITLGDDCDCELPAGLAGILWLVIIAGAAADNITLICRR